jgi:hypothetical protein
MKGRTFFCGSDFFVCVHRCSLEEIPNPHSPNEDVWKYWKFTVTILQPGKWECITPDDKETCPGRSPVYFFPQRLRSPQVLEGEAVLTERFILVPLSGDCLPGDIHTVLFRNKKSVHSL